jgi:hypothetical protein
VLFVDCMVPVSVDRFGFAGGLPAGPHAHATTLGLRRRARCSRWNKIAAHLSRALVSPGTARGAPFAHIRSMTRKTGRAGPLNGQKWESVVYGQITKYQEDIGIGVIEAEDGRKYRFTRAEVVNAADRLVGEGVDFLVDARRPRQIIMMSGSLWDALGGLAARSAANDRE